MRIISSNLIIYGIAHAAVDAVCAGVLFSILNEQILSLTLMAYLFLTYNLLAFGLQMILGYITDKFKAPRLAACLGIIITAVSSVIFLPLPVVAIVLAGLGNALFHIGGGIISLNLTPGKATAPGIFVAPGALGLLLGTLLGKSGNFIAWPFLLLMFVLLIFIFRVPRPKMYQTQPEISPNWEFKIEYFLYLVLFVVAVRSLVGAAVVFPWKSDTALLVMLTLSVVAGKGFGGYMADRFGWAKVAVGSLIISIPALTLGVNYPVLGMIGMFLFNITMPVTLTMVSNMIPGKPGLAFGLTCLALMLGTLPAFAGIQSGLNNPLLIDIVIAVSALALFFSLRGYGKIFSANQFKIDVLFRNRVETNSQERG